MTPASSQFSSAHDSAHKKDPSTERINPQSRGYRGGKLEDFSYFFADDLVPPQELPEVVTGYRRSDGSAVKMALSKVVDKDPCINAEDGAVPLYEVRATGSDGVLENLCDGQSYSYSDEDSCSSQNSSALNGRAIAVPGFWSEADGRYHDTNTDRQKVFTLSCMSGVAAKCVHWGYPPWGTHKATATEPATSLRDYFFACTHAARAEYKVAYKSDPSNTAYTCTGTLIDTYDRLSIQTRSESTTKELKLEAAWNANGPICIGTTRFPACQTEASQLLAPCDPDAIAAWPEGVLFVTRSTGDNTTTTSSCPHDYTSCSSAVTQ